MTLDVHSEYLSALSVRLEQLRVGQAKPIGSSSVISAIHKERIDVPIYVSSLGLENDQQADRKHHGGIEKAIHHYPAEHYQYWSEQPFLQATKINIGAFGENFSSRGLTERNVHIGDVFKVGGIIVEVSQGRQPCWKLNEHFAIKDMAMRVQNSLRTGWYYRVLQTGMIAEGDHLTLIDRPEPDWPLSRLLQILFKNTLDYDALEAMTRLDTLTDSWKQLAHNRLSCKEVENWHFRLTTPEKYQHEYI